VQLQAFPHYGKYSRGKNVAAVIIFHHVGKPAVIAQKTAARLHAIN